MLEDGSLYGVSSGSQECESDAGGAVWSGERSTRRQGDSQEACESRSVGQACRLAVKKRAAQHTSDSFCPPGSK